MIEMRVFKICLHSHFPRLGRHVSSELFVGSTTPDMTEIALKEFIGGALHKMGLTNAPENPVVQVRVNNKFAFIEFRTPEETANALNLNGIPFMGVPLKLNRPSKFDGPSIPYFKWEELLARYNSGELKVRSSKELSLVDQSLEVAANIRKAVSIFCADFYAFLWFPTWSAPHGG